MANLTATAHTWAHDNGFTLDGPHVRTSIHPAQVDIPALKEAFADAAVDRKQAIVFSSEPFDRATARWAADAGVGLARITNDRVEVTSTTRSIVTQHVPTERPWNWHRMLTELRKLRRVGAIDAVRVDGSGRFAILRLWWRFYQLDIALDGHTFFRGTADAMLDVLRSYLDRHDLTLDDFDIFIDA